VHTMPFRIVLILTILTLFNPASLLAALEQRTALVIGNGAYSSGPLKNPVNDATDMAVALQKLGFRVILKKNANLETMEVAIEDFGNRLKKGGVGLFYYAGHGVQVNGINYLIPIGAKIKKESDTRYKAVDAGRILDEMGNANNELNIVLLDACRDNPFSKSFRSASRGLAIVNNAPTGTFISYSTAAGQVAHDGEGRNSPYTKALLQYMGEPGVTLGKVFMKVRQKLRKETGQIPWELSSLEGEFYFVPRSGKTTTARDESPATGVTSASAYYEKRKLASGQRESHTTNKSPMATSTGKESVNVATVRLPKNIPYEIERAEKYLQREMWGNALIWLQKAEAVNPDYPDLHPKLLETKDQIVRRIRKSIAVFDFNSPRNNKDVGKIAANKLLTYLHIHAGVDLRIIERENLQALLKEMQFEETGSFDLKSALKVGREKGIDTLIIGDVLIFSSEFKDNPSYGQVKVLVAEEDIRNPDFSDWLLLHPRPTAEELRAAPPRIIKKKNYQFLAYKYGTAKINAMFEFSYRMIDTETGETIRSNTLTGKLTKENSYQDGVAVAQIPYKKLELPTEAEVLDELANSKISELGQQILRQYQSLEVHYFNYGQEYEKRRQYEKAIESYTDAIFDEKLKGISTRISKESSEKIRKLQI